MGSSTKPKSCARNPNVHQSLVTFLEGFFTVTPAKYRKTPLDSAVLRVENMWGVRRALQTANIAQVRFTLFIWSGWREQREIVDKFNPILCTSIKLSSAAAEILVSLTVSYLTVLERRLKIETLRVRRKEGQQGYNRVNTNPIVNNGSPSMACRIFTDQPTLGFQIAQTELGCHLGYIIITS